MTGGFLPASVMRDAEAGVEHRCAAEDPGAAGDDLRRVDVDEAVLVAAGRPVDVGRLEGVVLLLADAQEAREPIVELVIEPHVPLVVVAAVRHALLVVVAGHAGHVRRRQLREHAPRERRERQRRAGRERLAGERVHDRHGQDALTLVERRDGGEDQRPLNPGGSPRSRRRRTTWSRTIGPPRTKPN